MAGNELKPVKCGCGGEAKIDKHTYYRALPTYGVRCHRCGQETRQFYMNETEAITAWNRAMCAKDINVPNKFATDTNVGNKTAKFKQDGEFLRCGKCNHIVDSGYKYCPTCGVKLEWK